MTIRVTRGVSCLLLFHTVQIFEASPTKESLPYLFPKPGANLLFNNTQDPPVLTSGGEKRVIVHPRENVELTCPISCDPACRFHWTKRNESIEQWERFHFPKPSKSQLQIRALKHEDAGVYECLGVNGFGSTEAKLHLIVEGDDPSESNLIKRTPLEGTLPEILINALPLTSVVTVSKGGNLSLHCEATGYPMPNITWFKNNLYLLGSSDNVSELKLTNASERDGGSYRCEAQNEFGISKYKIAVKVEGGAWNHEAAEILSLTPANLTLFPGESGTLTCVVRSNATFTKPLLVWVKRLETPSDSENVYHHKGEPLEILNRTEVIQKSTNTYSTSLVFNNVTKGKAGTYVCVVDGPMEEFDYLEAKLFVLVDTAKTESGRQKAAQVQWTLLLTFCFAVVILLTIACFSQLYICRKKAKPPTPVSRSPPKPTDGQSVAAPSKSPGETVSTTLTHQNEIYERFIREDEDEASSPNPFSSPCQGWSASTSHSRDTSPRHCPTSSKRKRFQRQKRVEEFSISESSSLSDSVYESTSKFHRHQPLKHLPSPAGPFHHCSDEPAPGVDKFRLHRMPYGNRNYTEPPCTPVTAYSVNSVA